MAGILATFPPEGQGDVWQQELKAAFSRVEDLLAALELPLDALPQRLQAQQDFALRVPRPYVARMRKGDPTDPLLLQVLPAPEELYAAPGFSTDPLEEQQGPLPGVLHKYRSRVLLVTTGACAINCRYCFRRHFPYDEHRMGSKATGQLLDYLRAHPDVNEVILSGGDPLAAPDRYLASLTQALATLPQLTRLRIHSRLPVVIPSRITDLLLQWFAGSRLKPVLVLHINHAREIDADVVAACARLRAAGVTLLNQAVLLKGVNDDEQVLVDLSETLFAAGVLPYYLFLLDRVQGAAHFDVPQSRALELMHALHARLPGFLVPKLAREIANRSSKIPIDLMLG